MTYQYECSSCGYSWEVIGLSVAERDEPTRGVCPDCEAPQVRRCLAASVIRLDDYGAVGWAYNGYADNILANDPAYQRQAVDLQGQGIKQRYKKNRKANG